MIGWSERIAATVSLWARPNMCEGQGIVHRSCTAAWVAVTGQAGVERGGRNKIR